MLRLKAIFYSIFAFQTIISMTVNLFAFNQPVPTGQPIIPAKCELMVDQRGIVSATLTFNNPLLDPLYQPPNNPGVILISIPFELSPDALILPSPDFHAQSLSHGNNYTIFAVAAISKKQELTLKINNLTRLKDISGNRAALQFNLAYEDVPLEDRLIIQRSATLSAWDYLIVLPHRYEVAEVVIPSIATWSDAQTISIAYTDAQNNRNKDMIVGIPSPSNEVMQWILFIISIFAGILILIFESYTLRDRHISILIIVLVISSIVIVGVFYLSLSIGSEFFINSAFILPTAFFSFVYSTYLLLARKFEAIVDGNITVNGQGVSYATVKLVISHGANKSKSQELSKLDNGRFDFRVWLWNKQASGIIHVDITQIPHYETASFSIIQGHKNAVTVDPINLTR